MADDAKLLLWLLLFNSSSLCFCSELDVQCLKILKQSLRIYEWIFSDDGSICGFSGVECWVSEGNRILSLGLSNLGLEGSFPQGLQYCTSITSLDLSNNSFSGPIPSDISQQLPYLTHLDLSNNSFSGPIPVDITRMTYLNSLNLQHNQFGGEIPRQFDSLSRLISFNVAHNLLSGPIPSSMQKFLASNFAGNRGLCGAPLDNTCPTRSKWRDRLHKINDSSIGAAVGFVVGFEVAFYSHWFILSRRLHPYILNPSLRL